jgi:transcriptional regulator
MVVFQGPQAYVTPGWYATKAETGKVVPTWNYAIVQVRGSARIIEDPAWLRTQIGALTRENENSRSQPWAVDDAPPEFVAAQLKGIIGIEIDIETIDGKWKVSQNRPLADRQGVADGLDAIDRTDTAEMADLVRRYSK